MSRLPQNLRLGRALIAALTLATMLANSQRAFAWKPKTHAHLAEVAYRDAVDDGLVTIYATDYQRGVIRRLRGNNNKVVIGTYRVYPPMLEALRKYPAHFRAGVLGPDAYPDIATGQQIIHPAGQRSNGETEADLNRGGPGPDLWLAHLWDKAYGSSGTPDSTDPCRAFVAGYLTHAAGDIYGHTFVNHYTGDAFHFSPKPENAIKHIVLEGYVGLKTPNPTYDARIDEGVAEFIYRNMIDATPGSHLAGRLLTGENAKFSVPAIFCTIRRALVADIQAYFDKKADYQRRIDRGNIFDKAGLGIELGAFITANGPRVTYEEHWRDDITDGLKAWPAVSHEVAKALFYNPQNKTDLDRVKAVIDDYVNKHLLSMLGAPDFVGAGRALVGNWIDAVLSALAIPELKQAVADLKKSLYDFVLKSALGMSTDELKRLLGSPETQFDPVMTDPAFFTEGGTKIRRADFDQKELHLTGPTFDFEQVPAAYNTVVLTKLLMMEPAEVNRLMQDTGRQFLLDSHINDPLIKSKHLYETSELVEALKILKISVPVLSQPNAVLGFAMTLDGSNQWTANPGKLIAAGNIDFYRLIFMRQSGEKP